MAESEPTAEVQQLLSLSKPIVIAPAAGTGAAVPAVRQQFAAPGERVPVAMKMKDNGGWSGKWVRDPCSVLAALIGVLKECVDRQYLDRVELNGVLPFRMACV